MKIEELNKTLDLFKDADPIKLKEFLKTNSSMRTALYNIRKSFKSFEFYGKTVKVKEDTTWIYAGYEFKVVEVCDIESGEYGVYEEGSMYLRLSLIGTEFEYQENVNNPDKPYRNTSTVINTEYLEILD